MIKIRVVVAALLTGVTLLGCPPPEPNTAPTANAGPDQTIPLGETVTLDGSASTDADGDSLTFQWQFIVRPENSHAALVGAGSAAPRFTPDLPGTYSLRLTVLDGASSSTPDSVVITVTGNLAIVPALAGLTEAEAEAALAAAGLVKGTVSTENSATVPAGQVIRHEPIAGEAVLPGSPVDLVLSTGPLMLTVPDLTGQTRTAASLALTAMGLNPGELVFEYSETVAIESVIRTEPAAGAEVVQGAIINLIISLGPAAGNMGAVPFVEGLTRSEAEAAITAADLMVGTITEIHSETVVAGRVIQSDPVGGSIVDLDSAVNLVISLGPNAGETVLVPDLIGRTQEEAESDLANAGLTVGNVDYAPDANATPGDIIAQDPPAGTEVSQNSTVNITLAVAPVEIQLGATADLREALGDTLPANVARPDDAIADSTTGEIYIAARLTRHIAVYDTALDMVTDTIESEFVLPGEKRLFLAPGDTALYVFDFTTTALARIDRGSGETTANTPLDASFLDLVVDSAGGRLYVTRRDTPSLLVLDATTLLELDTSATLDGVAGDIALEKTGTHLLVLNTAREEADGELRTYDPTADSVTDTLVFDMPGSGASIARQLEYDGQNDRFFVRTDSALGAYGIDGGNPRTMTVPSQKSTVDIRFDPGSGRLLTLVIDDPALDRVTARGTSLMTYNPNPGQPTTPQETIPLGEANSRIALDTGTGTFLSADHTTGTIWTLGTNPFPESADHFALGWNIDQILMAGGRIFGASRFGNSTLFHLTPDTGLIAAFSAGTWPAPLTLVPSAGAPDLAVVNAWDSTLSLFSTPGTPALLDTHALEIPLGTTERLPDVAASANGNLVAVAWPEFGQVAVLDPDDGTSLTVLDIPNFPAGAEPAGKGQLQVLFDQGNANLLFVFDRLSRFIYIYDAADNFTPLHTTNLGGVLPDLEDAPEDGWLFHDIAANVLFVGPARVNPATGLALDGLLPNTQVVLAADTIFDYYWTAEQAFGSTGFAVVLRTIQRADAMPVGESFTLPGTHPIAPEFAFDTANRQFHVAYPDTTTIETYNY